MYSRYRKILHRKVQFPTPSTTFSNTTINNSTTARIVDFDIVDQRGLGAVIIFAYNTKTKTVTLLREYNPGCHEVLFGPAAGLVESKHEDASITDNNTSENDIDDDDSEKKYWKKAAEWELEEECHLKGGKWIELGVETAMDKYVVTKVKPFLVLDAKTISESSDRRPLDLEEEIEIIDGITIEEIWDIICTGQMNLVGGWACMLAIHKLEELGLI